ncbi:polysaccharide biosynthesis/export family protein [Roseovarius salis]|uniref:polysaccharide biosynthesis/export family protein n=1 Tax=Roseovarius salis TaxID=3376063 RepID=UPI0037C5DC92
MLATAPAHGQAESIPDTYVINIGDEVELDILDDNEPPQRFTVGRDGAVQLPYIGGVEVAAHPVGKAREVIRQTYVEREIFVNPTVDLSVAGFRPISVLGDVRNPGNFDFQPFMTAEQAVGLAGGPAISANNEEARVLERRNLEGELSSLEYDLAASAARYARVKAQLDGDATVEWADLPVDLRQVVNRDLFDEQKVTEDQIIALEAGDSDTRRELLQDAVSEAEKRVSLLGERETVQTDILETARKEFERAKEMVERGLVPRSGQTEARRAVGLAEDNLLRLREERSGVLVQLANLRSDLSQFDANRTSALLTERQRYWNEINKLTGNRASIKERIQLLSQWMNAAAGLQTELLVEYKVRRRSENGVDTVKLQPYDELLPGDLLVIAVMPLDDTAAPAKGAAGENAITTDPAKAPAAKDQG